MDTRFGPLSNTDESASISIGWISKMMIQLFCFLKVSDLSNMACKEVSTRLIFRVGYPFNFHDAWKTSTSLKENRLNSGSFWPPF